MKNTAFGLFGLQNTNKDFQNPKTWGKNQFNNTFPTALACYMASEGLRPVYLCLNEGGELEHKQIQVAELFGLPASSSDLHFFFEGQFTPYATMVLNGLESVDLITSHLQTHQPLRAIEIKLTALPDYTTIDAERQFQGSELVIRPQTISYLALSIAQEFAHPAGREFLSTSLAPIGSKITSWNDSDEVKPHVPTMIAALKSICLRIAARQTPLLMQTIWRTTGNANVLDEDCFDIFVWSNLGFIKLFTESAIALTPSAKITRAERTICWVIKMLYDFGLHGKIDTRQIQDQLTYNTRNDKSFAMNGSATNALMKCNELTIPRVKKSAVREIILGDAYKLLRPERRLDAAILGTPGLFE